MEKGFKIKSLKAFITEDVNGTEGLIAEYKPGHGFIPFVCADEGAVNIFRDLAKKIAKQENKRVKLVEFSVRTELEEF